MDHQDQRKGPTMERRKTMTMNWEGLGEDDDDDRFFETYDRLSSAISVDLASSGSDDDEFDDSRMSFASAISGVGPSIRAVEAEDFRGMEAVREAAAAAASVSVFGNYDMWMAEPGSIKERRRRLLQGMGLNSNKNLISIASTKIIHSASQKITNDPPSKTTVIEPSSSPPSEEPKPESSPSIPILLVRSRSDGDIVSFSANTRKRKDELIGAISKQRLTRTSSMLLTPQAGIRPYANTVRVSPKTTRNRSSMANSGVLSSILSDGQFSAFFLIKNLDTGKEFIVKEYNDDGMWNRLSEVQTGKQLTMEEFEKSVGYSPVVKELMRRENVSRSLDDGRKVNANSYLSKSFRYSKRRGTKKERIKSIPDQRTNKNSNSQWIKVRQQGKSIKEFTAMHLCQEIQAHEGSIWTMRFSPDARYLASAGEDKVIHIWEVQECEVMSGRWSDDMISAGSTPVHPMAGNFSDQPPLGEVSPLPSERRKEQPPLAELSPMPSERRKRGKASNKKKGNIIPDYVQVPETVFSLSERPVWSFMGHLDDVLDLSWSKSQLLLSASMDKTVRLWDMETKSCLKLFAHNDYVTSIQFNPIDDDYFISGSLDAKVRLWNIPDRQLVDYTDLHEMVTAAAFTPDGQGALIGSHTGICRLYSTADCNLEQKEQIELRHKKKSQLKKITGFEFSPCNPSEVLVTSADSRIRIIDGPDVVHKFRGFRNTSSQISASFSADGKYVVCASEDSQVYIWKREEPRNSSTGKSKGMITTNAHEHFQCREVSVAIPWPGSIRNEPPVIEIHSKRHSKRSNPHPPSNSGSPTQEDSVAVSNSKRQLPPLPKKNGALERSISCHEEDLAQVSHTDSGIGIGESFTSGSSSIRYGDSPSISNSSSSPSQSWSSSWSMFEGSSQGGHTVQATAWGVVIVTASLGGEIRAYQNFGLPVKVGRQVFRDLT
ncbi:transducin/WD40 repeat-like superfamily protein [Actinidia rufa]|uniref:Transducin/WD40 repeat-like superfamily protein n=1 Tax=Actinidia rufa TaxID=165716 RepID=A0A7J0GJK5_9ERIC|nr:transducin/WD40 repeat-like superfamily protein [Actinidia rufa]